MKTTEVSFEFPVLGISADNDLWGFADLRSLTTCGPRTLSDNMQTDMELIDARGCRWIVRDVHRQGRAGPVLSRWLKALLSGPIFRIEQELEAADPLSLAEVQSRVCASMAAHPDFWCEDDERETVLPARLAEVRATKKIVDVHRVLGLDTFEAY